jgi:DNA repair protein RecO (recombination protein O)
MGLVQDSAICLRKFEFSETSQVLTLLTRSHGAVRVIAKGAHRRTKAGASKFDGGVDLLDLGQAVFSLAPERDLPPLTEWTIRDGHAALRKSLRAMHLALYAAELCGLLIGEHDPHPMVFDQLKHLLAELATTRREEAFVAFELDLLDQAGLLPELGKCVSCAKEVKVESRKENGAAYFSMRRSGVICGQCADALAGATVARAGMGDRRPIDARLLRLAAGIMGLPRVQGIAQRLPKLTRRQSDPINALLADYVQHSTGRGLKVAKYVF